MNKRKVDEMIPRAYEVLKDKNVGIAENNMVRKAWRGQISSLGAAIATGDLLASIAFFSNDKGADVPRSKLLSGIGLLLEIPENDIFKYLRDMDRTQRAAEKERIIEAAVALKLAMNLYELEDS